MGEREQERNRYKTQKEEGRQDRKKKTLFLLVFFNSQIYTCTAKGKVETNQGSKLKGAQDFEIDPRASVITTDYH